MKTLNSKRQACIFIFLLLLNIGLKSNAQQNVVNTGTLYMGSTDIVSASGNFTNNGITTIDNGGYFFIKGNWSNTGTFNANLSTITFNSTDSQSISGSASFNNLTINNNAGVSLLGTLNVTGILLASNGNFNTGGFLTLVSTSSQTALIDGSGAGNILGIITMQRYLPSGFGYKYLSSPFQSATVNEFSNDLDLAASFPTLYRYDENKTSSGWVNYIDVGGILNPGEGYAANLGSSSSPKTIEISGVVNNNTISTPTLYNHNQPYTQGFNLIGNPYPSPIDWNATNGWVRTNIDNAVYYFKASTTDQYTGTYSSYINGISSDGIANNIISSMQGFFVHVSNGTFPVSAQITFNNSVRVNDLTSSQSINGQMLRLDASFDDREEAVFDPAVFYFDARALKTFDKKVDALKLMNTNPAVPNLYAISSDAAKISIRALSYTRDSLTVQPIGLKIEKEGWVSFNARDIKNISESMHIYLFDAKTNIYHDLRENPNYRLYMSSGDHTNRFSVIFSLIQLTSNSNTGKTFNVYTSRGNLYVNPPFPSEKSNLVIVNMLGEVLCRKALNSDAIQQINTNLVSGVYVVTVSSNSNKYSKKVFIGK